MSLGVRLDERSLVEVANLLGVSDPAALPALPAESLRQRTHRQLLEVSRRLGLQGVSRLTKDQLATKLALALPELDGTSKSKRAARAPQPQAKPAAKQAAREAPQPEAKPAAAKESTRPPATSRAKSPAEAPTAAATPTPPPTDSAEANPVLSHKFEVGRHGAAREEPRTIPWSYGIDRVTGMAMDPDRLFVYWEITDDAIARARASLGAGGAGAWLNLRVYDVTGRIFDGTNAHSYFDHKVERHDRQWFFGISKPSSQAVVEAGLRSHEGFFVKIARSGKIEFPRRASVGWAEPEWMSVKSSGEVESAEHHLPAAGGAPAGGSGGAGGEAGRFDPVPLWQMRTPWEEVMRGEPSGHEERIEWEEVWSSGAGGEMHRTFSWQSPMMVTSWEAGPFTYPVEEPSPTMESFAGALKVFRVGGRTHMVYGPWQVVIRGLGASFTRQVLGRWEVQRSWVAEEGHEVRGVRVISHEGAGSSELMLTGASERRWRGESELRLVGGSERFFLGASERRVGGASETVLWGASERLLRGASERLMFGASEMRLRGASERLIAGASERRLGGGSEARLGGGSEARLAPPPDTGDYPDTPTPSPDPRR